MPEKFTIELDERELATVIAALHWWNDESQRDYDECMIIAGIGGSEEPLQGHEIDDLAERINAASAPKVTA